MRFHIFFLFNNITIFFFTNITQINFKYFFSFIFNKAFFNNDVIFFKNMRLN